MATLPGWMLLMVERDELNLDDPSTDEFKTKALATREELFGAKGTQGIAGYNGRPLDDALALCNGRQVAV